MQVSNVRGAYLPHLAFEDVDGEFFSNLVRKNFVRAARKMVQKFQLVKLPVGAFLYQFDVATQFFLVFHALAVVLSQVQVD